jgi:hypothetical protein
MITNSVTNALTIDFEDWYQGLEIPIERWAGFEDRLAVAGRRLDLTVAMGRFDHIEPPDPPLAAAGITDHEWVPPDREDVAVARGSARG